MQGGFFQGAVANEPTSGSRTHGLLLVEAEAEVCTLAYASWALLGTTCFSRATAGAAKIAEAIRPTQRSLSLVMQSLL